MTTVRVGWCVVARVGLCLVALVGVASGARAETPPVAASPTTSEESDVEDASAEDEPEPRAAPEADYLALADAPLFLPRNYFYWGTPVGPRGHREPLVFGLEYALHLPLYNNVRESMLARKSWAGALTLSFEGALRMLATESNPVRMPSYRPSVSAQVFYAWHRAQPLLFGLRSAMVHYSNGQERCAFDEKLGDESEACFKTIASTRDLEGSLNRKTGNFSTTGWLGELYGRVHVLNANGVAIGHLAGGVGYTGVFNSFAGSLDAPTRALYGNGRLEISTEGKKRMGWASMTVRAAVFQHFNDDPRVPSTAGQTEVVVDPYWLTGMGFFLRYRGGRDSYNAFFVDRLQQFSGGLAWDGERPLTFKR